MNTASAQIVMFIPTTLRGVASARRFSRYLRIVHARNVQRGSIAMQLL